MSIQQGEGWYLWEKSMVMHRQALRRTVTSMPRRDRLASMLGVHTTFVQKVSLTYYTHNWLGGSPDLFCV
jgi:hypothetical protein